MTYHGVVKGKRVEFDEELPFEDGQSVRVDIQPDTQQFPRGSPQAVLEAVRQPPHLEKADTDELERLIAEGQLPVRFEGEFDNER